MMTRVRVLPTLVIGTVLLAVCLNAIQPVTDTRVSPTDPLLLVKLAIAGIAWVIGIWGVMQSTQVRAVFGTLPGALLLSLGLLFIATSFFASEQTATISIAAALILFGYLMLIGTATVLLDRAQLEKYFLISATCYLVIAWIAYVMFPSFGQFYEYTDARTTVARMGGLAHPNAIAKEAAVTLLVCLAVIRRRDVFAKASHLPISKLAWGMILVLILATLAATLSRTALLAGFAGAFMLLFDKLCSRRGLLLGSAACVVVLSVFLVTALTSTRSIGDSATSVITKSGDVEELTSLTGRTRIWAEAMALIAVRPLTGYGMDSAASVMSKESIGTHNLLLHVVFSSGIVSGMVMLGLLGLTIYLAVVSRDPLTRGIMTFVLVSGLVEDTLFASFPEQATLLWILLLLLAAKSNAPDHFGEAKARRNAATFAPSASMA